MTQTLAERIRSAREHRGWTQEQLAVHADVSRSTIQNLENGRRQPHRASIRRIADALGIAVDALLPSSSLGTHELAELRAELEDLSETLTEMESRGAKRFAAYKILSEERDRIAARIQDAEPHTLDETGT